MHTETTPTQTPTVDPDAVHMRCIDIAGIGQVNAYVIDGELYVNSPGLDLEYDGEEAVMLIELIFGPQR